MNEPLTRAKIERTARIARVLIDAALNNLDIQDYIADTRPPALWTVDSVTRNPTIKLQYQHAAVIAGLGESFCAAKNKNWGPLTGVLPLEPNDPVHPFRVLYVFNADSPYQKRFMQRRNLKRILGPHRKLVGEAMYQTKGDFLKFLKPAQAAQIEYRLKIEPGRFWRAARGREFLSLPTPPIQLTLYPD